MLVLLMVFAYDSVSRFGYSGVTMGTWICARVLLGTAAMAAREVVSGTDGEGKTLAFPKP